MKSNFPKHMSLPARMQLVCHAVESARVAINAINDNLDLFPDGSTKTAIERIVQQAVIDLALATELIG